MDSCDETPCSDLQSAWQDIALRLRMAIDRTLAAVDRQQAISAPDDWVNPEALHNLATAALSAFALERQANSLDAAIRRDGGGWG